MRHVVIIFFFEVHDQLNTFPVCFGDAPKLIIRGISHRDTQMAHCFLKLSKSKVELRRAFEACACCSKHVSNLLPCGVRRAHVPIITQAA